MLADEFNCDVSGIDMSHEFIRTATELSRIIKLNGRIKFVQGDALELPYDDQSFDVVWTQHVQMNIEDKEKFYSEIHRVLKTGGSLVYYDIFKKNKELITYPVPWANDASLSFLGTISNMESILKSLEFSQTQTSYHTLKAIEFLRNSFERSKKKGPPNLGLNVLMGTSTMEKLSNVMRGLQENKIELQSGIYIKK